MKRVSDHRRAQSSTSSTPPMTDSDIHVNYPHESEARPSVFSDAIARVGSRFNHFRSVIHDPRARVASISAVDKEVATTMQLLRSLRNALVPISLLPREVLARVFYFLSLREPPRSGMWDLGWIRATHVCRLWRQVALDDSSLWARISGMPTSRELVSEMLARARNAPLDIDIYLGGTSNLEVLLTFPPHLSRTRELRLHGLSMLHSAGVRVIYDQEAPALEHFKLDVSVTSPVLTFWEPGGTTLFKGRAPRLRTLSLLGVFIPWSFIPRGQLTQLEISLHNATTISHIYSNLSHLIDLLVNCPELEILVLESCLPSRLAHFPNGQIIHFPLLSRLRLSGSSSRITNLLKMLKLPTSTTLQLYCTSENASTHNDHLLLPVVLAHFQNTVPVEFKQLSLSFMNCWLEVTASTSLPKSKICQSQDFESYMDGELALSFDGVPRKDLIERVCKMLPISNIESLHICAPDVVDPIAGLNWAELFKRCPEVTTMQAIGRGTSSLVRALTIPKLPNTRRGWEKKLGDDNTDSTLAQTARSTVPHAHAPIFPKLTFLSFKSLNFGESLLLPPGILFDVVENGLRQRKVTYGGHLKMLCIDNCTISTKRAKALQKLVQELLWDGQVRGDKFEDEREQWWGSDVSESDVSVSDDSMSDSTTSGEQ